MNLADNQLREQAAIAAGEGHGVKHLESSRRAGGIPNPSRPGGLNVKGGEPW